MKVKQGSLANLSSEDGRRYSTDSRSEGHKAADSKTNVDTILTAAVRMLDVLGRNIPPQFSVRGTVPSLFVGLKPIRAPLPFFS